MNRAERRRAARTGKAVKPEPTLNIKLSDLAQAAMTPTGQTAMLHEINQQCLEAEQRLSQDLDVVVLWTLSQCYGFGVKRLHKFYLEMAREHQRMRHYYQIDDLFPERLKLKERGVDLDAWQKEIEGIIHEESNSNRL